AVAASAYAEGLAELVARALAEDLGPGDVTTEATVPDGARSRARIVQKQPGVVFGLAAVAETMRQCGVDSVDSLVVEGQWRGGGPAGRRGRDRPPRRAAGGRAARAQLPRPPLGNGDADGALRRGGGGDGGPDPRHPQDDAGPAGAREAGRGGGGRGQSPP